MSVTAITVEGVLRREHSDAVLDFGRLLYGGLGEVSRLALVTDGDLENTRHWLDVNGFSAHPYLLPRLPTDPEDPAERRLRHLGRLREAKATPDLFIDPNPAVVAVLYHAGIPALLPLHPAYARPEFRPDHRGDIRPWAALVEEISRATDLRGKDARYDVEVL